MPKLKLAVVGSRTYPVTRDIFSELAEEKQEEMRGKGSTMVKAALANIDDDVTIVSGGARGPDTWAVEFADETGWESIVIRPNWKKYGSGAGFHRNTEIVDACDELIAFWDLESNGTWDSVKKAAEREKPLLVIGPTGDPLVAFTTEDYKTFRDTKKLPMMAIPKGKM